MLEKQIEKRVCDYARSKGTLAYKFTSPQRAAVPDRLMITPSGVAYFIEFKAEDKKPAPAQEREHQRLRDQQVKVFVVDSIEQGKQIVDRMSMGLVS